MLGREVTSRRSRRPLEHLIQDIVAKNLGGLEMAQNAIDDLQERRVPGAREYFHVSPLEVRQAIDHLDDDLVIQQIVDNFNNGREVG